MADLRDIEESEILRGLVDQDTAPDKSDQQVDEEVEEHDDGSATIRKRQKPGDSEFYRNLAEDLDPTELNTIATSLLDLIEDDKKARAKRDEQYEEGLKRMGLSKDTIGGANFTGASIVTHPMYTKACIDFEARSIKELMPPGGPVREYIPGTVTTERADRARRKAKWMNLQFTQLMPNFRAELEQLLIQLPMAGNQYLKFLPPERKIRIEHEWIPADEMLLPEAATNFYGAERRTHVQKLTAQQFAKRVRSGMYRDINPGPSQEPENTKTEDAAAKIEGKESDGTNPDGKRLIYECDCLFEIRDPDRKESHTEALQDDSDGEEGHGETEGTETGPAPYLISIDSSSREVLSIYRNWDERDEEGEEERLEWVAPFDFIPFRGAYAVGLPHIIGGLSVAATGALRALLDKAHISNFPGMVKLKGAAGTAQTIRVDPTAVSELDGNVGETDDIRKLIMPIPFGEPSAVLFNLLGFLDTKGEQVIRTTLDEANDNANMPVGTQMMRIEQGMVVFSAIHGRLHNSMDRALKIVHRIDATYLEDKDVVDAIGEQLVTREDFDTANDVIPVSDPNIFCELQRYGQIQTVAQRAQLLPQVYDLRKVELLILKQLKLPNDGKDLLIPKPEPQQLNPVNENIALTLGRPIVAFPQQDHDAHLEAHCDYFESPLFQLLVGSNPASIGALLQHFKEHIAFWYGMTVHEVATQAAGKDIGEMPQNDEDDPEVAHKYDQMLAAASVHVMQQAQEDKQLQRAVQAMQKLQQMMQQMAPPPPTDPGAAAMADVQRQTKKDQTDAALKGKEIDTKAQQTQSQDTTKLQQTALQEQGEEKRAELAAATKQSTTAQDNATAISIAADKSMQGIHSNVSDGESVGKTAPKP